MSLSAWEQQALDSIKDGLADSDPQLAALLTAFTELASGAKMPAREKIRASSRWVIKGRRRNGPNPNAGKVHRYAFRIRRCMSLQAAAVLIWLSVTAAVIGVALILSHGGGQAACTGSWVTFCAHATSTSGPFPASHG
jgi:hypothetical protein